MHAICAKEFKHICEALENVGSHVPGIAKMAWPRDQVKVHVAGIWLLKSDMAVYAVITYYDHFVFCDIAQKLFFCACNCHDQVAFFNVGTEASLKISVIFAMLNPLIS